MTATTTQRRWVFWAGFAVVTLIIAGVLSYLASSSPDGLDSATLKGCDVVEVGGSEQLRGDCIAQHAGEHALSDSPLAGYSIAGDTGTSGVAGIVGVVVTVAVAGGLFWLIARSRSKTEPPVSE